MTEITVMENVPLAMWPVGLLRRLGYSYEKVGLVIDPTGLFPVRATAVRKHDGEVHTFEPAELPFEPWRRVER